MQVNDKIIDENLINTLLEEKATNNEIDEILNKALLMKGLSVSETAKLLNINDNDEGSLTKLYLTAKLLKEKIYGKRIVFFAPLYASNYCSNNCVYCAFRKDNKHINRVHLTPEQVVKEAEAIMRLGHKRIVLLTGEDYIHAGLDYLEEIMDRIYKAKVFNGEIRRININIAPLSVNDFKRLNSFGIGTYQLFQETYNKKVYEKMHPAGKKANYEWRLEAMDRAMEAGISDVGIGALFGMTDYRFETLATLMHAVHLDKKYGCGPHTISVPRIEPAQGVEFSKDLPAPLTNTQFKKLVAALRLAVPYTGLILSTREQPEFRRELLNLGISQISAGSKVNPGGYTSKDATEQFEVGDNRSLEEVVRELVNNDFIPSFCTSCYRAGRVGKDFMDLAKPGLIKRFCNTNALTTLAEYLLDYASEETQKDGFKMIAKEIENIEDLKLRTLAQEKVDAIKSGSRDVYV